MTEGLTPGDILVPKGKRITDRGVDRLVVYRVAKHGSVFYWSLTGNGSGAYCGPGAIARCLRDYDIAGRMRFEGAFQLYRKEWYERHRLRGLVRRARDLLVEL